MNGSASPSFLDKYLKSGAIPIHLIRCKDMSGRDCYRFLMCSMEKIKAFKEVMKGAFDLKDYGTIIASGYGHTPSQADIDMIKEKYNFDATQLI